MPSSKFLVSNPVRLVERSSRCNRCIPECIRDKRVKVALNKKLLKKAGHFVLSDSVEQMY